MVRTDQSHISQLLEQEFDSLYKEPIAVNDQSIRDKFNSYFEQCRVFLFGQINHMEAIQELHKVNSGKGVCAKTLSYGDVAWKCETCEKDPTCIICQECFEKSNHKGHKVWLKRNVGGCCDCGDPDAWEKEGFCSDHKGYSVEALLQSLPYYVKSSAPYVFNTLSKHLHYICLKLSEKYDEERDSHVTNESQKRQKCIFLIKIIFEFMDEMVDACAAFIQFITDALNMTFFTLVDSEDHSCCIKAFINEDEQQQFNKSKRKLSDEESYCTCTTLDLTMQTNHIVSGSIKKIEYEFYFKLFQSYKFKQILGLSYISNLEVLYLEKEYNEKSIQSIGVQILTIDEIAMMIAKDTNLRVNIDVVFGKLVDRVVTNAGQTDTNNLLYLANDIKYMCKPEALKYLLEQTHFLERLLSHLPRLYFLDAMDQRTEHITFDLVLDKRFIYELELQLIKVFKTLIKEIDYTNLHRNKELVNAFLSFFEEIKDKMTKDAEHKGFFSIPLHRIFSFYLDRLILKNYFLKTQQELSNKRPAQIMHDIMKKYVDVPPGVNNHDFISSKIDTIITPLTRSWAFIHEILAGKWVLSGLFVVNIPNLFYSVFEYYLLLDLSLFQLLISVSPQPQRTIQTILDNQSITQDLQTLYRQLQQQHLEQSQFKQLSLFDPKKLRTHFQWALRLFIQLSITEIPFIYSLKSQNNLITYPYDAQIKSTVDKIFKGELKRELVHNLIKNGGRADIKTIKEQSQTLYTQSEQFEEIMMQITSQSKDTKGKMSFKLDESKYLQWFDPFYYLVPNNQAKVQEVTNTVYQSNKELNTIVGDYKQQYQYQTAINSIIQEALAQSALINIILHPLVQWINKTSMNEFEKQIIDDQIGHECLKLLIIILQNTKHLAFAQKHAIVQILLSDNGGTINTFLGQLGKDNELEPLCREILAQIYYLDEKEFNFIGERLHLKKSEEEKMVVEQQQQQVPQESNLSKQALKEAQKKKKMEIMKSFQAKRQQYIVQNTNQLDLQKNHSSTSHHDEEIECSFCKETLLSEHYYNEPYGQFAYISKTKLMYHTIRQTIQTNKIQLKNLEYSQIHGEEEEEKKGSSNDDVPMDNVDLSYLNQKLKSGAVFVKCQHYAHFKCLNTYLVTAEADLRNRDIRKLLGLDMEIFQCPLCKHIANVILPSETLKSYDEMKEHIKDFNKDEFLDFYITFFSKVVKLQNNRTQDTLLIDIQKYPQTFMRAVQNFFVHRFQLIDLKGTTEFLKKDEKVPGIQSYATLLSQLGHVMRIIYNETTFPMCGEEDDFENSTESFESLCSSNINTLLSDIENDYEPTFEKDFSIIALKILFFISMKYQDQQEQYEHMIEVIQVLYKLLLVQALIKLAFLKHNGKLKGTSQEILNQLDNKELQQLSKNPQLHDQFIQAQLQFLRKVACFVLMVYYTHRDQDEKLKKEIDTFCHNLAQIQDDTHEHQYLTQFLSLDTDINNIFTQQEQSSLADTLEGDTEEYLKQIGNSTYLMKILNDYKENFSNFHYLYKDLTQNGENQPKQAIEMPDQLRLLTTYYNLHLIQLPQDYQTFVQEYYKTKCKNCDKQAKENVICLLCGDTLCWLADCCKNLPEMRPIEGELTYHTRLCEGGCSMFISTSNAQVILIDGDRSASRQSPYMNKFGETFNKNSKKWENFYIDEEGGGKQAYEELRKMYMNFSIPNEVVKERSMKDSVYRLRIL